MDKEVVIKIPEDFIELAKTSPNYYPVFQFEKMWRAVKNGVPLPKGHGDLIDRNELFKEMRGRESCSKVLMAQAIIKADKESEQ